MENCKAFSEEKITDSLLEKKIENYGSDANNFYINKELTVIITLNEYRELVKNNALREYKEKKFRDKNCELQKQVESLMADNKRLLDLVSNSKVKSEE